MKKKRFSFWKLLLWILILMLLALAGGGYYLYRKVNDIGKYQDKFAYDYETKMKEDEGHEFKDCIFYDRQAMVFEYEVPAYYLYTIINEDSMGSILSLPEELKIDKVGIEPRFDEKEVDIYLSLKFRDLINTCLKIETKLQLSEDEKEVQLAYKDFFVIDDKVTEEVRKQITLTPGTVLFTHKFPVHVPYYRMPDYRPAYVFDLDFDGEKILAKYDIASAMKEYLAETEYHEDPFDVCMEKIDLEVRMNGIAHSAY